MTSSRQPADARNLTLDFGRAKRVRNLHTLQSAVPVITTPDVQMLKLTSPEMAKFLSSAHTLATPNPSTYLFPKTVTEEQELYAKGFEEALHSVRQDHTTDIGTIERAMAAHRNNIPQSVNQRPSSAASSVDSTTIKIKQERMDEDSEESTSEEESSIPRPGSSISPIDMERQEVAKLERKRLRNRIAATKCRKRKLDRISTLDERVGALKDENSDLAAVVKRLKATVCGLKQEVMEHVHNGCQIMVSDGIAF